MKKIFFAAVFALFFYAPFVSAFQIEDFDGSIVSLDDKTGIGKWTVVMFWAHDCGICRAEFPLCSDFNERRGDVDVIGISIDGAANKHLAQEFLDISKPSFPSYLSSLTMVSLNYQVITEENFRGTPTFLLFTPEGELIGSMPGKLYIGALEEFINQRSQSLNNDIRI